MQVFATDAEVDLTQVASSLRLERGVTLRHRISRGHPQLRIPSVESEGGTLELIDSSEPVADSAADAESGKYPFFLHLGRLVGELHLVIRGRDGNAGKDGAPGGAGSPGTPGSDAQINVNLSAFSTQSSERCVRRPTNGSEGGAGQPGGDGENGQPGGDAPTLILTIDDTTEGRLRFSSYGGIGGQGGRGAPGGPGGPGGPAGKTDLQGWCPRAENGPPGKAGASGKDGVAGASGRAGTIEWSMR